MAGPASTEFGSRSKLLSTIAAKTRVPGRRNHSWQKVGFFFLIWWQLIGDCSGIPMSDECLMDAKKQVGIFEIHENQLQNRAKMGKFHE